MLYTLPDGKKVKLENILRISQVRDQGSDSNSIGYSKMTFTIHLKRREEIDVSQQYHFSDWAEAKVKLLHTREDLMAKWKEIGGGNDED